jgi:hypothetical protein
MGYLTVRGTYKNLPAADVYGMTHVAPEDSLGLDAGWWPQEPVRAVPISEKEWITTVHLGAPQRTEIHIVKANRLGQQLIAYYKKLRQTRGLLIGNIASAYSLDREDLRRKFAPVDWCLPESPLGKGLDSQDSITVRVVNEGNWQENSRVITK